MRTTFRAKFVELYLADKLSSIVFDDADLGPAVESAAAVKFRCSGQVCIASNRILVQRGIYDQFAAALVEKVKAFKVGPGIGK